MVSEICGQTDRQIDTHRNTSPPLRGGVISEFTITARFACETVNVYIYFIIKDIKTAVTIND